MEIIYPSVDDIINANLGINRQYLRKLDYCLLAVILYRGICHKAYTSLSEIL